MIGEEQRKDVEKSAKSKSDGGDFVVVVAHKQGRQDAEHDAHTPETFTYFPQDLMMELTRPSVEASQEIGPSLISPWFEDLFMQGMLDNVVFTFQPETFSLCNPRY